MPKRIYKLHKKIYRFSEDEILDGNIARTIAYLSVPLVLGNIVFIIYSLAELFWLGKLGTRVLAAMAYTSPILSVFHALGAGFTIAGGILVAQYKGAKIKEGVDYAVSQTIVFTILLALLMSSLGICLVKPVLHLLSAPSEIIPLASSYLYVAIPGILFTYGFFLSRTFFRSVGNTTLPMVISFLTAISTLFLEPFLIFGWSIFPKMGFVGAALSIIFGQGLSTLIGFFLFYKGFKGIRLHKSYLLPDPAFLKCLLRLSLPVSMEIAIRSLGTNIVLPIISGFGTTTVAAFGVGSKFLNISFTPVIGISQAIGVITGQNIGAKQRYRVMETVKKGVGGVFIAFSLIGVLAFWQAESIAQLFALEPAVLQTASQFLKTVALSLGFLASFRVFIEIFRGTGNTLRAMFISFFTFIIFQAPLVWLLSYFFQTKGIWWAFFLTNIIGGLFSFVLFLKGRWQTQLETDFIPDSLSKGK